MKKTAVVTEDGSTGIVHFENVLVGKEYDVMFNNEIGLIGFKVKKVVKILES